MLWRPILLLPLLEIAAIAAPIEDCPGYTLINVAESDSSITGDLILAGNSRLHVKIYDENEQVYQIPRSILNPPSGQRDSSSRRSQLVFEYTNNPFSFAIQRSSNGETIFNTSGTNLIFQSQYVRLRTSLPANPYIYGIGEDSDSFRRETTGYTRTLWNVGQAFLPTHSNLYSSHPIYIEMRGGQAHGVFLSNSNGMDIKINQNAGGEQYLEYNIIGGVLDFYFLSGPAPADVARQYAGVVGTPAQQSYWTYGFHQCKYGYQDVMWVAEVAYNYSQANIPLETMWTDIDYMDLRRTWNLDPDRFPLHKMQELVAYLHNHDQQYIMMVDPPVSLNDSASYNAAVDLDVLIKYDNGTTFVATMWPGAVSYVDWFHPNAQSYWTGQIESFFDDQSGVGVDGMWIDMNEPANFCGYPCSNPVQVAIDENDPPAPPPLRTTWDPIPGFPSDFQPPGATSEKTKRDTTSANMTGLLGRDLLYPGYRIANGVGSLTVGTIWTDLSQYGGYVQYDTHNLYASYMIERSRQGLLSRRPSERPFIISRSTFAGDGTRGGHWTGDNASTWAHYLLSIFQNMEFASIFQMPMVGADVCGFNDDTTETLCARWAMLGAWYPFYRNHADISAKYQEFYRWPLVTAAAQKAIAARFQLLDYLYTAFYQQTVDGSPTTIIPLFFEYPNDPATLDISYQFFFGPSILVSPVTVEGSQSVSLYLPPQDIFYDFWTGERVTPNGDSNTLNLDNVTYTDIPVHIRGGSIVPLRSNAGAANTTTQLRRHDFELLVAPDVDGKATGSLYIDDGKSVNPGRTTYLHFMYDNGRLSVSGSFDYNPGVGFKGVTVLGSTRANAVSGAEGGSGLGTDSYGRTGVVRQINEGFGGDWTMDI
uniref:alpha-glucosidase n=1 Tax=Talaromyces marneffei PM1 TaxID=1077442 RepID=A0A093UWK1_TALMA